MVYLTYNPLLIPYDVIMTNTEHDLADILKTDDPTLRAYLDYVDHWPAAKAHMLRFLGGTIEGGVAHTWMDIDDWLTMMPSNHPHHETMHLAALEHGLSKHGGYRPGAGRKPIYDEPMSVMTIRIPQDFAQILDSQAAHYNTTRAELLRNYLTEAIAHEAKVISAAQRTKAAHDK